MLCHLSCTVSHTSAVSVGGSPDPELNAGLAAILKRAKTNGVPKENIDRALKKVYSHRVAKRLLCLQIV